MSVVTEEVTVTSHVCSNCEAKGSETILGLPEGWVEIRIKSGKGIHLDSVVCGDCESDVKKALAGRRSDANVTSLQQKVTNAREAGEETIKVTQKGSGREATVKVSEFDEPKEAVEPVKAPKAASARRSAAKDIQADVEASNAADAKRTQDIEARLTAEDAAPVAEASGKTGPNATGSVEESK